ncbi:MAG: hypothetical protein KJ685_05800, partial [Nanoarchaeota archaeon]|nr:hypothetical protein [Nanoarchaeota archaeon]
QINNFINIHIICSFMHYLGSITPQILSFGGLEPLNFSKNQRTCKRASSEEALNTVLTIIWKRSSQGGGFVCKSVTNAMEVASTLNSQKNRDGIKYITRGNIIIGAEINSGGIGSYSEFEKAGSQDNIVKDYNIAEITGDPTLAQYALTERYDFSTSPHDTQENNLPHLNQNVVNVFIKSKKFDKRPENIGFINGGTSNKTDDPRFADGYQGLGPAHLMDLGWTKKEFDEINQKREEDRKKRYIDLTKPG